jgi:TRAP-type uncharacterized transport system fused permease subunit
MKTFVLILIITLLTAFVFYTAVRIEVLNARAVEYLPRRDKNTDRSYSDGKWRISLSNSPRDELREIVQSYGLMQYLLAPLLLILSVLVIAKSKHIRGKFFAGVSILVSVTAIYLMFSREYLSSLGLRFYNDDIGF